MTKPAPTDGVVTDHWLDEVTSPSQPLFDRATHRAMAWFAGPARLVRQAYGFVATTPGKLTALTLVLTVAIGAAGLSMANFSSVRHERLDVLLNSTEPMNSAAHKLYTSLSLADTVATTGFVQVGLESADSRARYHAALDRATVAATESVLGTDSQDREIRELVVYIQRQLPVYAGMVETARANHREDNAVAVNYMSNASALMREEILPAAAELFRLTGIKVEQQQNELTSPQWVPISGFLAALALLLAAQWWLWRLSRRRFNRGFLAATALLVIALAWVVTANVLTWTAGSQRFESTAAPWEQLTNAQIAAQQARTTETLMLVSRQASLESTGGVGFEQMLSQLHQALDAYEDAEYLERSQRFAVYTARAAADNWSTAHHALVADLSAGRYDRAVAHTTGMSQSGKPLGAVSAAESFNKVDHSLTELIADTRDVMRSFIQDGVRANRALGGGVGALTVLAIICVCLGIRPRLQEYL
ncbi:hypothetical protein G7Y31_10550 [Corynebacterium lizhenjunii]|uniref:Chemotaxis methyl-accepting receptor HlyB-like 4HB MCP domain-containing protein n=1 Tax=Corynebacterium lizhenjunii TaxID=2709394 RepID=A0A7T0KDR7_9CORY|nr:hypothetical protein [Corynebacterium lizhenjunii]QPK78935.1 hypothetical protein G7Y31_10550 [Corynebacterium lizhenjunii]